MPGIEPIPVLLTGSHKLIGHYHGAIPDAALVLSGPGGPLDVRALILRDLHELEPMSAMPLAIVATGPTALDDLAEYEPLPLR
jgi:hypothetical protein